ncbi:hypothetical protein S7335_4825 [Synechococcus sp. PCC 7335]|uniref:cyanoexosortase A n=1 Tax=Synechococcus sp. (strain ATCC 29403 / PCC 7335) TaxID=91464 RepID=UPI00017ECE80|nr:cyanoexosortase A [Synechococcus sp. PCC 7335]EDX87118.1 hypothetical protein S7335_4825 [Synechococcus sp. PCC 7335]
MSINALPIKRFKDNSMWLLAIFAGLVAINVGLCLKADDGSLIGSSILYWAAVASMVWSRKEALNLRSGFYGTLLGLLLMSLVLVKSAFMQGYDPFLRVLPFLSMMALGFLASGFTGIRQFWKELSILLFLTPPPSLLERVVDTSAVTAKFSTALLWYAGFQVARDGKFILVPNGGVEVYSGCSGVDNMLHLFGLAIVFIAIFPTTKAQKWMIPMVSLGIAFAVNGVRVSIMAALSEPVNKAMFDYWHKGDGSLLFSMISVVLLGAYCFFLPLPESTASASSSSVALDNKSISDDSSSESCHKRTSG